MLKKDRAGCALFLIVLSIAVFNWGLQYKMSLYQQSSGVTHSPAKLLIGKSMSGAWTGTAEVQVATQAASVMLSLFLCPKPEHWLGRFAIPWKLQVRAALRAYFFRPPPIAA